MKISFFEEKPNIDEVDFYDNYYRCLKNFNIEDMPNLLFNGPKGSGKTIKIYSLLCSFFDKRVYTLKQNEVELEKRIFKFKSSIYHIEIDCSELVNNERIFFSNYLKDYCSTRNIGLDIPKIIYIINIEKIHKNSLLFLRKLIESTYNSAKYIFETCNSCCIPNTLLSRFFLIKVKSPKKEKIEEVLKKIIKNNKIKIPKNILNKIINLDINYKNYHDLNNIFLAFNYYLRTKTMIRINFYHTIDEIINIINTKKLDFYNCIYIKNICEKIFINCYEPNEFIDCISKIMIRKYKNDFDKIEKIIKLTLECDSNLYNSTGKYFIHLENYFIKLILLNN